MADLDMAIRAEIDHAVQQIKGCEPDSSDAMYADQLRAALLAVLDRHKKYGQYGKLVCGHCVYAQGGDNVDYPCETVEDIANALGIEEAARAIGEVLGAEVTGD